MSNREVGDVVSGGFGEDGDGVIKVKIVTEIVVGIIGGDVDAGEAFEGREKSR